MTNQALQYFMHDGPSAFRFELAGDLDDDGARRLLQDWHVASSAMGDRALIVDMTFVTSVDQEGRSLIARWHAAGAQLVAKS
jgi:anti-anti-sigma regulatory factor